MRGAANWGTRGHKHKEDIIVCDATWCIFRLLSCTTPLIWHKTSFKHHTTNKTVRIYSVISKWIFSVTLVWIIHTLSHNHINRIFFTIYIPYELWVNIL